MLYLTGVAHYHADDYVRAIEALAPMAERFPEQSLERREVNQVLGLSLYLAGRIPDSLPFLERTRVWAADNAELNQILGMAYVQTRQPAKAREVLARAPIRPARAPRLAPSAFRRRRAGRRRVV